MPCYAAHLLAARAHLLNAEGKLDALAVSHATRSVPQEDGGER